MLEWSVHKGNVMSRGEGRREEMLYVDIDGEGLRDLDKTPTQQDVYMAMKDREEVMKVSDQNLRTRGVTRSRALSF